MPARRRSTRSSKAADAETPTRQSKRLSGRNPSIELNADGEAVVAGDWSDSDSDSEGEGQGEGERSPRTPASPLTPRKRRRRLSMSTAPKTPPHFRRNSFVKSGYRAFESGSASFDTLSEVTTETGAVYSLLFGAALLLGLWANIGYAVETTESLKPSVEFNLCIGVVVVAMVVKALSHILMQVPSSFQLWAERGFAAEGAVALALLASLAVSGHKFSLMFGILDGFDETAVACAVLAASVVVSTYQFYSVRAKGGVSSVFDRFVSVAVAFAAVELFVIENWSDPRVRCFSAWWAFAAFVDVFKLPERIVSRTFDKFGNSTHLYYIFFSLGAYEFFVQRWVAMTGREDLLFFRVFC